MTKNDNGYLCDICKKDIMLGTGFSFPVNLLGIEHAHQSCYNEGLFTAEKNLHKGLALMKKIKKEQEKKLKK